MKLVICVQMRDLPKKTQNIQLPAEARSLTGCEPKCFPDRTWKEAICSIFYSCLCLFSLYLVFID